MILVLKSIRYLLSRYSGPFINRWAAHLNISLICITYQCFRCFEPALSSDMVAKSVLNGDLRLFAYVQSSWLEHVREFCKLCPHDREQIERLSLALRDLFRRRNASLTPNFLSPGSSGPNSHQTFSSETLSKIQDFSCLEPDLKGEFMRILEYRKNLERKLSTLGAGNGMCFGCVTSHSSSNFCWLRLLVDFWEFMKPAADIRIRTHELVQQKQSVNCGSRWPSAAASYGGLIAWEFATAYPHKSRKVAEALWDESL